MMTTPDTLSQHDQTSRRCWLRDVGGGLGSIALAHLLARDGVLADLPRSELYGGLHHPARARRVLQLFMNGGVSQIDTFDYKPELIKVQGQQIDVGITATATSKPGPMMKSPFKWRQHGECGQWVTDVLPHMAKWVDDLAFLMAMQSGQLHAKHWLRDARFSLHGSLDFLWPRFDDR